MSKKRRNFTADQKVSFIRKHLIDKVAVSDICDDAGINVSQFYRWQTEFFENGANSFTKESNSKLKRSESKNSELSSTVTEKNGVIAELVEENIRLKKQRGLI